MSDYQVRSSLTLPGTQFGPAPAVPRTVNFKTIPYGPPRSIFITIQAIAHYKRWTCSRFMREVGYSSNSISSGWLRKGVCPSHMEFVVEGWLAKKNLVAVKDAHGAVQIMKATPVQQPPEPVEVRYTAASVPLTAKNVLDLIGLCANNGEQQLIVPLANLLGDKNVTLEED
jgi:hypothetical protein|tara:strand:- start:192 stop:704 length:513 start_codon:yes stop_codon:yes gene_type:complete